VDERNGYGNSDAIRSEVWPAGPRAIGMSRLGQPAITIVIELWTKVVYYESLQGELGKAIVERFRAAQIEFSSSSQPVPAG
jgi:small-conductance mechanosensitive channel